MKPKYNFDIPSKDWSEEDRERLRKDVAETFKDMQDIIEKRKRKQHGCHCCHCRANRRFY